MFPAATAAPFARNVARRGILAIFSLYSSCVKPRSHIHVRGYGPRGLITDREVTDETCSSSPVLAGKHVPTVRVRNTRAVGGFDQGNSGLYHGLPWRHR